MIVQLRCIDLGSSRALKKRFHGAFFQWKQFRPIMFSKNNSRAFSSMVRLAKRNAHKNLEFFLLNAQTYRNFEFVQRILLSNPAIYQQILALSSRFDGANFQSNDRNVCFASCLGRRNLHTFSRLLQQKSGSESTGDNKGNDENDKDPMNVRLLKATLMISTALAFMVVLQILAPRPSELDTPDNERISWNTFVHELLAKGEVAEIRVIPEMETAVIQLQPGAIFKGQLAERNRFILRIPNISKFEEQIRNAEVQFGIPPSAGVTVIYERSNTGEWIALFIFVAMNLALLAVLRKAQFNMPGGIGSMFDGLRKANFRVVDPHAPGTSAGLKIKFKDVAGLHEAKVEVQEFVDYLKRPESYTVLGAKLPKGALLLGPPGCGKTLLAKALAAEATVPFLAVNGTEFIEMIGGLGASRVRDLFKEAKSRAPCIIYMDEIDAIGKKRSGEASNLGGSSGEAEQTLNQLLVELDGMSSDRGVMVLASTNRADILDNALLRRGRFDRHITIDLPNAAERKEIFQLYLKKVKLDQPEGKYSGTLAQITPGFSGADINNVVNEAALYAATNQEKLVTGKSLSAAMERVIAGPQKRSTTLSPEEREVVAYHEAGHALVGWLLEHTDALLKISIVPRTSAALGFTQNSPADSKLFTKEQLFERMCMTLGGRAAENEIFRRITSGAEDDLKKVTRIAFDQVKIYGMDEGIGPLSFGGTPGQEREDQFLKKPYSKRLQTQIDRAAFAIVTSAYRATEKIIAENKAKLEILAKELLKKETLSYGDVKNLIGPPPHGEKHRVETVDLQLPTPLHDQPYPEP